MAKADEFQREELQFARAVTFFDAIFAFAVTLLITTVDDFSREAWSSLPALLRANGSSLAAFAISFIVVVSFWRANHQQVTSFRALDSVLVTLNCVAMFWIVLIPFTTQALGKSALEHLPLPVAVYAVNIILAYVAQAVVLLVADRRGLSSGNPMTTTELRRKLAVFAVLPLVFLISIPLAYAFGPGVAEPSWIAIPLLIPLVQKLAVKFIRGPAVTGDSADPAPEPTPGG